MPLYDLICTSCGYEKGETMFSSYDAFQKAEKERECPECHSKLEAKLSAFSITGSIKTTNCKIVEQYCGIKFQIGQKPCGQIGIKDITLFRITHTRHDPEMN